MAGAPLPRLINGVAILLSITADRTEDKSADSPPGSNFPALDNRFLNPSHSFPDTASKSNPSENPFANEAPILTPSSKVSPRSIPSKVIMPTFKPVPIPSPMSCAKSANFAFPVLLHQSEKGSARFTRKVCHVGHQFRSWELGGRCVHEYRGIGGDRIRCRGRCSCTQLCLRHQHRLKRLPPFQDPE